MRYFVLATDYDGTLATDGHVRENTLAALERLRASGRKLILVTGRQLDDLQQVFQHIDLFDYVVAENGALLYSPATRQEKLLGSQPPSEFIQALRDRHVEPLSVGKVIVATWHPHETTVLQTIRDLGLELQVIFNKGAVMVLPSGINKAAGLLAALNEMKLSPHNVVGVGDAENDHAFLNLCELSVAVGNALPMVKERVDFVTQGNRGDGVVELIDKMIADDVSEVDEKLQRHKILLGTQADGSEVQMNAYGTSILLAGTSGGGKSTLATALLERIAEQNYQFCIIDPEGDYENFEPGVILGDTERSPRIAEVQDLLEQPQQNLVVNLLGIALQDRPAFFAELLAVLLELRSRTGRPHWIVVDEAHHLIPASWNPASLTLPQQLHGMMLITVHPDHVASAGLSLVDTILTVGNSPEKNIKLFCETIGHCPPQLTPQTLEPGEALAWFSKKDAEPFRFRITPGKTERRRHVRKYAEGELGEDKSFYFRGPDSKLNLRAQNLILFTQIAEGVDDETWLFHLQQGDYSCWLKEAIKDESLADEVAKIEKGNGNSASESREAIKSAIAQYYTLPS
ncbi:MULTISPECIES: HAD-IIB family hydrolase [Calothrix]|uniref:HAD-IIB family hydrolase n=2 Tax=Calothrix TaxID=1186 RepID=A0ABR8ABN4_9CYAN|nr:MULTISPECIES: HAD-IIB family hydrolase [Calothrix]MBD2197397.1 HAD-IIB family hydrolase [Calothrix parietina FACHB-288]MBD2225964.1 HAD-IIB family hydrolase [Calothrix anomala FACHB-343]